MSGRSGYRKSDHPRLGRFPKPRTKRVRGETKPDWRLSFALPHPQCGFVREGATRVIGVTVAKGIVEARGGDRDWVLSQAAQFLGTIAGGMEIKTSATLERLDEPAASNAPGGGRYKATRDLVYVPGASVVFLHPLKGPIIFSVVK